MPPAPLPPEDGRSEWIGGKASAGAGRCRPPAHSPPAGQEAKFSVGSSVQLICARPWAASRPRSPAGPVPSRLPGGRQPCLLARLSLVPSISPLTLPAYIGGPGAPGCQTMQVTLVLLRCLRPHLCLSPSPPVSSISCLTHHVRSHEAAHPSLPASLWGPEVLVALTGVEALQRSWNCIPGTPPFYCFLSRSETGAISVFPLPFPVPVPARRGSSEGAACCPAAGAESGQFHLLPAGTRLWCRVIPGA